MTPKYISILCVNVSLYILDKLSRIKMDDGNVNLSKSIFHAL